MITILSQRLLKYTVVNLTKARQATWGDRLHSPTIPYFGYGGNLNPQRFEKYQMNAEPVGVGYLPDYKLTLSLPCEYVGKGYASIEPEKGKAVWGYLYRLDRLALTLLDIMEYRIFGHYKRTRVSIVMPGGERKEAFVYIARYPTSGLSASKVYKESILSSAKEHGFPELYIKELEAMPAQEHFELDPGYSLMFPSRRRPFETILRKWYLQHDKIRERVADKLRF